MLAPLRECSSIPHTTAGQIGCLRRGSPVPFRVRAQTAMKNSSVEVLEQIREQCEEELKRPYNWCTVNRRKVLESMQRHWSGLTVLLSDPGGPRGCRARS